MKAGHVYPDDLSSRDKTKIRKTIQKEILAVMQYPNIRFEGEYSDGLCTGNLTLKGLSHKIKFGVSIQDGECTGRVEIRPTRWGIKPYKALMGAIKLQDRVVIEFTCMVHV